MKVKSSFKYLMGDLRLSMTIFYGIQIGVTLCITILGVLLMRAGQVEFFSANNSMDSASVIFLLVVGLATYKDSLLMHAQNGVSRGTFLLGRLTSAATAAVIMTAIDQSFAFLLKIVFKNISVQMGTLLGYINQPFLYRIGLSLLVYFFAIALGTTISALFYRLSKTGRILVGAGVPVALFLIWPLMEVFVTGGNVFMAVLRFIGWAFGITTGKAYMALISMAVLSAFMCLFSWLLARRAPAVSK